MVTQAYDRRAEIRVRVTTPLGPRRRGLARLRWALGRRGLPRLSGALGGLRSPALASGTLLARRGAAIRGGRTSPLGA